jgi:5-oxoprolinase (ATP-hydrolysing) subunit A
MSTSIDLNSDIGERPGALDDDRAILRSITSANVACGFHAGDPETMRFVCEQAAGLGVTVGAHVSYLDRNGFGRRDLNVAVQILAAQVTQQIMILREIASAAGAPVRYVKSHGALYNRAARDPQVAAAVAAGVQAAGGTLPVLTLPGSELAKACADHGLASVAEGFADRGYLSDGSLAPRSAVGAVLDHDAALAQVVAITAGEPIAAVDGTRISLLVRSLCLHSDTPGAAAMAGSLRSVLADAGVTVEAFA